MSTIILDDLKKIKKLDSQNMLGSIEVLYKQFMDVQDQANRVKLPASYKKINNIIVCGMGGSTLGAHVIKTLFRDTLNYPLEILNVYHLPKFAGKDSLVVISAYSGTTEEPVNAAKEALKKGCKIAVITTGGLLAPWAKKNNLPLLLFAPKYNPCNQPRMGVGYSVGALLSVFNQLGLINFGGAQIKKLSDAVLLMGKNFAAQIGEKNNVAKKIALKAAKRTVWYVGAEHLAGSAHVAANQMNENGKRFAGFFLIPELNHHLMEGMANPKANQENLLFVLFESSLYDKQIQKRFAITKDILKKNKIAFVSYKCKSKDRLAQVGEVLALSSHVSFYTAIICGIDPSPIPYVDYFKEQLAKK